MNKSDYLVIGAGINGLLLSLELADAGASVTLVEKSSCFAEASWAGGGIVSPLYPWRYEQSVTALASQAQQGYLQIAARLLEETGIDVEFVRTGLLMLEAADRDAALHWSVAEQQEMFKLTTAQIYQHAPMLRTGFQEALWMPQLGNVRNPRLGKALVAILRRNPRVTILEHTPVLDWQRQGSRIAGVITGGAAGSGRLVAGKYAVTSGAWSASLLAQCGIQVPIKPIKGEMLLFEAGNLSTATMLLYNGKYVIPRKDGQFLVGSTLEDSGFDKATTSAAKTSLLDFVRGLIPALRQVSPKQQWAGLRPGSPGGVPFIDLVPGVENLYINAGQFRNGLVLAPASARLMADLMLGRQPMVDPLPYRFSSRG